MHWLDRPLRSREDETATILVLRRPAACCLRRARARYWRIAWTYALTGAVLGLALGMLLGALSVPR